jgi:hypothetical protein
MNNIDLTPLFEQLNTVELPVFFVVSLGVLVLISTVGSLRDQYKTHKTLERLSLRVSYLEAMLIKAARDE